jgi:hypothetical protein
MLALHLRREQGIEPTQHPLKMRAIPSDAIWILHLGGGKCSERVVEAIGERNQVSEAGLCEESGAEWFIQKFAAWNIEYFTQVV